MVRKKDRDVERTVSRADLVAKLRRLADALEQGTRFRIQIGGLRLSIPADAICSVEHEREGRDQEIELQVRWTAAAPPRTRRERSA